MTRLRLLQGGMSRGFRLAGLEIAVARREKPPFAVEAYVVEDDTYLVLAADPAYREPTEHMLRVMTAVHQAEPAAPGTVVARSGDPLRLHAIIHDLARDPTWTEEWVSSALLGALETLEGRRLRALALPPLGSRHGALAIDRFLGLLAGAIETVRPAHLRRIWLVVSTDQARQAARWFAGAALP